MPMKMTMRFTADEPGGYLVAIKLDGRSVRVAHHLIRLDE